MAKVRVNYTNKDYEAVRQELVQRIPTITDRWTDFNESDLGMVLLELFCGLGDMLLFYLDNQANEAYLPTARQRQNVIHLTNLVNYRLDLLVAATTTLYFRLAAALPGPLTIPKHTRCRATTDQGNVDFATAEDLAIAAGALDGMVGAVQGVPSEEGFTTDGTQGQVFHLAAKDIAQGSIEVWVGGVKWTEVRTFYESTPADAHYILATDALDQTSVTLGDGQYGLLPPGGQAVAAKYLKTLGAGGNIGKRLVNALLDPVYFQGEQAKLTVTNIQVASNGNSREQLDHARRQAPAELASLWRAVTKADYIALAEGYPGVAKAQVLDVNNCLNMGYYHVCVVIAPDGGGLPSQLLKNQVLAFLNERKLLTVTVHVKDPVYVPMNIDADIYVLRNYDRFEVLDVVLGKVRDTLAFDNVRFGQDIYFSDLVALIDGVEGVSHVVMRRPTRDISIAAGELAVEGTTNITALYVTE
ncbi:MAG TPA: baseplate J/gp47 family protein [Planctomycetota bacterium]|nr:baseplate J/gp47 family protein [Planctomycetota bacterium]HRR81960.1 baseplate J/gp47 family protein [Planctomycetota bacterium]HRT96675.1 baseplate J/gp47 family protein [Planctomycetota bacterium]